MSEISNNLKDFFKKRRVEIRSFAKKLPQDGTPSAKIISVLITAGLVGASYVTKEPALYVVSAIAVGQTYCTLGDEPPKPPSNNKP